MIRLNSGDNFLAGPEIEASRLNEGEEGPVDGFDPSYDVLAPDAIGDDAFAIGNHEFDFGPKTLAEFIGDFGDDATFVSANLDFSGVASLQSLVDAGTIVPACWWRRARGPSAWSGPRHRACGTSPRLGP